MVLAADIVLGWEQIGWPWLPPSPDVKPDITCLHQTEKENDGGRRGDQFGVHPAGWLLVEI